MEEKKRLHQQLAEVAFIVRIMHIGKTALGAIAIQPSSKLHLQTAKQALLHIGMVEQEWQQYAKPPAADVQNTKPGILTR